MLEHWTDSNVNFGVTRSLDSMEKRKRDIASVKRIEERKNSQERKRERERKREKGRERKRESNPEADVL